MLELDGRSSFGAMAPKATQKRGKEQKAAKTDSQNKQAKKTNPTICAVFKQSPAELQKLQLAMGHVMTSASMLHRLRTTNLCTTNQSKNHDLVRFVTKPKLFFSKPHLSLSKKFRRPLKAQHVQCRPGRLTYQSSNTHPTFHPVLQWENSVEVSALRKAQLSLSAQKHLHVITGLHWWTMQLRYVLRSGGIANLPSNSKDIKNGWLLQSFLGVVETY